MTVACHRLGNRHARQRGLRGAFDFTGTLEEISIRLADRMLTEDEPRRYGEGRVRAALAR